MSCPAQRGRRRPDRFDLATSAMLAAVLVLVLVLVIDHAGREPAVAAPVLEPARPTVRVVRALPPDRAELARYIDAIREAGTPALAASWMRLQGLTPTLDTAPQAAVDRALALARTAPVLPPPGQ